ncbi:hypothetical protein B446_34685 [Streptomyces collinus Tu 365]|uniref:Uncharacterized protein n=1 Tax=Streptomyces collinus (strain DSM 40733 / Tue 365) TaxID=1214242 RepID=S5V2B8_STRC3|nr:hypothetical protein B446_00605 [Streptomyces collinus Tu 365]AGS73733.1 hypothetical protein B446_34685 [Streptomyces collinus Tu 365]
MGAGRWDVVFETRDEAEWQAYMRRLRAGEMRDALPGDESVLRIDVLCGRLVQPTTYRLSAFVADPAGGRDAGDSE